MGPPSRHNGGSPILTPAQRARRKWLGAAGLLAVAPALGLIGCARTRHTVDPFTLGVASGTPRSHSVVLWTRLAPDPLHGGGLDPVSVPVRWEVATDEGFRSIVRQGVAAADAAFAHSVHVQVDGLTPDRWYWYRFLTGDATSPFGRTRTTPLPGTAAQLRFAFASCQQYEQGYYAAHRHMAHEELDLVVFLGDYIYESSWGRAHVRKHEAPEPYTLEQYRNRYARYKSDPDLQRCHARFPWIVTWDDHEVQNDYADDRAQNLDATFLARRAAAYRAYYEHMPLPVGARPDGAHMRLYDHYDFGDVARLYVLDGRQYRSYQACQRPDRGGSRLIAGCRERHDARRTMLGGEQEAWLAARLAESGAQWNIVAQQTLMAQARRDGGEVPKFWNDGWDGYPAARRRLLEELLRQRTMNPLVIGGDLHANIVADLKLDFDDPRSAVVATEFCGTSIASQGLPQTRMAAWRAYNPHLHYARSDQRGYVVVALNERRAHVLLRTVENEKQRDSPISTSASFAVEANHPGAIAT